KIAGSVASRKEKKSARGNRYAFVQLSDPSGLYEVTVFADVLETARDLLEPGMNVVLSVKAELEGDTLKLLANSVQPIDQVAAEAGASALRINLGRAEAAAAVASLLDRLPPGRIKAQIILCVSDAAGREIDLTLAQDYPVTPGVKGALKAVPGVLMLEDI
ncbi:MAG: DNA polymerase III subunit alpha, partial [Rhodobacterales bacterium]|nr:DNA polymerase III subunit alpha [Rhodobacterales bacterium]